MSGVPQVTPPFQFVTEKVLGERTGVRLMEGSMNFLANIAEFRLLAPIQKELKALDGAISLNNSFMGISKTFVRGAELYHAIIGLQNVETVRRVKTLFASFFYDLNKTVGDSAAGLKFLGRFVPAFKPHDQFFGIVKNVSTLMKVAVDSRRAFSQLRNLYEQANGGESCSANIGVQEFNYRWWWIVVKIGNAAFSALLNGFGVLDAIFCANMKPHHRMPPVVWIAWGMSATLCGVAENRLSEYIEAAKAGAL